MLKRRGQIAIFIILGIILVALIIFLIINFSAPKETSKVSTIAQTDAIKNKVESCIEKTATKAIYYTGLQGGYFQLPDHSTKTYQTPFVYYLKDNTDYVPTKSRLEHELSAYIEEELFFCFKNFIDLEKQGFKIEQGEIAVITTIQPDSILFLVDMPLRAKRADIEGTLFSFSRSIKDIRLQTINEASQLIVQYLSEDPESACMSCINFLLEENDLQLEIYRLYEDTLLLTLIDPNSVLEDQPYKLIFGVEK